MFNILPDNLKQKIKAEYKLRFITVILVFIFLLQTLSVLFMLPSLFISRQREQDAELQKESYNKLALSNGAAPIASIITDTNKKLNILETLMRYPEFSPLMTSIISRKTNTIQLNEFAYTSNSASTSSMVLGGTAASRDALVSFVKSLQEADIFTTVDLPISNLTKEKDIDFRVNLRI